MNINKIVKQVTLMEKGKHQINIADAKEFTRCLRDWLLIKTGGDLYITFRAIKDRKNKKGN